MTSASPRWMTRMASPMQFEPVAHAVTTHEDGPWSLYVMETWPAAMFAIIIGTKNGLMREGPFAKYFSYCECIVSMPPTPVMTTRFFKICIPLS